MAARCGDVPIDDARQQVIERNNRIEQERKAVANGGESGGGEIRKGKRQAPERGALHGACRHQIFRADILAHDVEPEQVVERAREAEAEPVENRRRRVARILAHQRGAERNEGNRHQQEQVQDQRRAVHALQQVKERVMIEPNNPDHEEAGDIAENVMTEGGDHPAEPAALRRQLRHLDLDYEKGHHDGNDGVGECLEAVEVHQRGGGLRLAGFAQAGMTPSVAPEDPDWATGEALAKPQDNPTVYFRQAVTFWLPGQSGVVSSGFPPAIAMPPRPSFVHPGSGIADMNVVICN